MRCLHGNYLKLFQEAAAQMKTQIFSSELLEMFNNFNFRCRRVLSVLPLALCYSNKCIHNNNATCCSMMNRK